jgi:hypothetical protein
VQASEEYIDDLVAASTAGSAVVSIRKKGKVRDTTDEDHDSSDSKR